MSANYREPQFLLPNCKNLKLPGTGTSVGSGLTEDRHSLYSMDFDGTTEKISFTSSIDLGINSTISFWVKFDSFGGVLIGELSYGAGYLFYIDGSNIYIRIAGTAKPFTHSLSTNQWYNIIIVRNGDSIEVFVNNTSLGTQTGYGTSVNTKFDTLGHKPAGAGGGSYPFKGDLDEVAGWSRALSNNEINDLWNGGSPSNPMLLSGKPEAYYPLGEQARKPGTANWRFPNEVLQGQAIDFDGTDYIESNLDLSGSSAFTASAWVKRDQNQLGYIVGQWGEGAASTSTWAISCSSAAQLYFFVRSGSSTPLAQATITNNEWTHVMGVWTGSQIQLYVNGDLQDTVSASSINNSTREFKIGVDDLNTYYFDGKISNVAIWDTDQSANITNIYNYGAPQTSYTVTPKAWYKLDKTSKFTGLNPNWHSALSFDGVSGNKIDVGTIASLNSVTEFTVSFWSNFDNGQSNDGVIFTNRVDNNNRIVIYRYNTSIYFHINSSGSNQGNVTAPPIGSWTHIVMVYDGSGSANADKLKVYFNGVEQTLSYGGTIPATTGTYSTSYLGARGDGSNEYKGDLSNFSIFKQAISAEDVKYLYNGGTPQTNISFEPTSWYKLDNLTTGIQDSGSGSNNGTNNGATEVASNVAVDEWVFDNAAQSQTPNWTSALEFNLSGVNYLKINGPALNFTDKMSFSAWAKFTSSAANVSTLAANFDPNTGYKFQMSYYRDNNPNSSLVRVQLNSANNNIQTYNINGQLDVDTWHHLAFSFDGTTNANGFNIYINNVKHSFTANNSGIYSNTANGTRIGNYQNNNTWAMIGEMSNVAFWDTNLSTSQINDLYNNGQPEATISHSPLSYYKLDNIATGIEDSGSASNNANIIGTVPEIQTNVWTPRLNADSDTLPSTALVSSDLQFNSAYSSFSINYDGVGDSIDLNDSSFPINGKTAASFSFWIKAKTGIANYDGILTSRNGNDYFLIYVDSVSGNNFKVIIQQRASSGGGYNYTTSELLTIDNWYNITITGKVGESWDIYVNGNNSGQTQNNTITAFAQSANFKVGEDGSSRVFIGNIDEVSIFDRKLNLAEVTSIYNNGYPKDITALSPISWLRMGEDAYFDGTNFTIPNKITSENATSTGLPATALVADAPGSYAAGLGSSLVLADRLGDAPLSTANSLSFNMTPENRISYAAGYTPAQVNNVDSMNFDSGSSNYFNAGTSLFTGASINSISISCWIKTTSTSAQAIISKDQANSASHGGTAAKNRNFLLQFSGGNLFWQISPITSGTAFSNLNTSGITFTDGNWHHIVATYEAGSTSGTAERKIYVNGELKATDAAATLSSIYNNTSVPIEIGRRGDAARYFDGNIDELAIFDYALSARQVKEDIYNGTTSGKTADLNNSNLTPPIAWYRMGD